MSRNCIHVRAPASQVFEILANPLGYASFVVGAKQVRRYDPSWPAVGAAIHHTFGVGPMWMRDATTVVAVERNRRLVLDAGMGPMGASRISFTIEQDRHDAGCTVWIEEDPCRGPIAAVWNRAFDVLLGARNLELLRRLQELAEAAHAAGRAPVVRP